MKKTIPIIIVILLGIPLVYFIYLKTQVKSSIYPSNEYMTEQSDVTTTFTPSEEKALDQDSKLYKSLAITLVSPKDNATVTTPAVTVSGNTASYAEVFVNDIETKAIASGDFSVTLPLDEGDNYIIVIANDEEGNYVEKELSVTYDPGQ